MAQKTHQERFPKESARYRVARDKLLAAEVQLRKQVESVAKMRRKLPLGGQVPEDYLFDGSSGPVKMSELFRDGAGHKSLDTLLIYSFMYGPDAKQPCPMCTSFLDSVEGAMDHLKHRASMVVVAKSPLARIQKFAQTREWGKLRLLSSAGNSYNRDYHGENPEGAQMPMLNVFTRRKGKIFHTYATELHFLRPKKGQDQRHIDMMWPLWNLLDLTPEGRGDGWYPSLND